MPTVVVRPRALVDLAEIWSHIAEDSADHADTFTDLIDSKFQVLARRPGIGRSRPELATDLRSFAVGNYVIFYIPLSKGVEVVRVLHGARDLEAVLGDYAVR
jgi:toxin ParE1/3/4